ncbi:MAG: hypothetical protein AAB260_01265 [Planctomycetota bacterium]|jgi:hypothetical protein
MELTERELAQIEALREVLRARIVDTMVLKNQLIQILECLTGLVEQRKGKT